jgi:hypothetical protein
MACSPNNVGDKKIAVDTRIGGASRVLEETVEYEVIRQPSDCGAKRTGGKTRGR